MTPDAEASVLSPMGHLGPMGTMGPLGPMGPMGPLGHPLDARDYYMHLNGAGHSGIEETIHRVRELTLRLSQYLSCFEENIFATLIFDQQKCKVLRATLK